MQAGDAFVVDGRRALFLITLQSYDIAIAVHEYFPHFFSTFFWLLRLLQCCSSPTALPTAEKTLKILLYLYIYLYIYKYRAKF